MKRPRSVSTGRQQTRRCAIYTRVSTDHGLDQDFNSLDAQREACEAYIRSQTHEGWTLVHDRFDDGGYSGGSLERPALAKLLAQMEAGRIDIIVVYKVDRLTRSLADFAKLVERFDAKDASFVSITQSFNSTSSMGRLTLNMLLSFAQFEREVTGERIRDKIAASKRKGIWVGGNPPFGYVVANRKLVVEAAEAATVKMIFDRYLLLGSLDALLSDLRTQDVRTRIRTLSSGKTRGGVFFGRGALAALLKNRSYLGELNHHGESFPAEHDAILDQTLFDRVQEQLTRAAVAHGAKRASDEYLLTGLLFDDRGFRMTPSSVRKKGRLFRYYLSRALFEGAKEAAGSLPRVSAPGIEGAVLVALQGSKLQGQIGPADKASCRELGLLVERAVIKIVVSQKTIAIDLTEEASRQLDMQQIVSAWEPRSVAVRREVLDAPGTVASSMRSDQRATMLTAIASGRIWLSELQSGTTATINVIAAREKRTVRSTLMTISLSFLAPTIIQEIIDSALPRGIGVSQLYDLPACWTEQRAALGLVEAL